MSERAGDERRVEELLRVNAALAAEVRSLTLGRTDAPRRGSMPTARSLAVILDERDALIEQLEACRGELEATTAQRAELGRQNHELAAEVRRLRSGLRGLLRRTRARLGGA
jgi:hypothetical protein